MLEEFSKLANYIKYNSGNLNIVYVPGTGNWGDGLIHSGQVEFFKYFGINVYHISRIELVKKLKILNKNEKDIFFNEWLLIQGGGGAWCQHWNISDFVRYYCDFFNRIIVMPSTYELPKIKQNKSNITYFARDKFLSKETIPESIFCPDMAFFLKPPRFLKSSVFEEGNFFRTDKEKNDLQVIPKNNIDISLKGNEMSSTYMFFKNLDQFNLINTDRMHVAIAASLLNKKTNLYPGNYRKIDSVYYSSIDKYFKSTTLKKW